MASNGSTIKRNRKTTLSLDKAMQKYLDTVSIKKKGYEQEISIAKVWLSTNLKQRDITSIKRPDLIKLRDLWLETYKPATVIRRFAVLSHLFTIAQKEWGYRVDNPAKLVTRPQNNDARDRRIFENIRIRGIGTDICPKNELEWIIDASESKCLPTILTLAVETAMRRSEICSIQRKHVNLIHGVIHLPQTKNGTKRDIPLSPFAKEALRLYLSSDPNNIKGFIFRLTASAATKAFIRARRKAKKSYQDLCKQLKRRPNKTYFHDLRFHDLRHEATSRLATVFDMHELAKITGHKDTRMLLRYYHPKGFELTKKLAKSHIGKKQSEVLKSVENS